MKLDFFRYLGSNKIYFCLSFERPIGIIPCHRVHGGLRVGPWPETFVERSANRLDQPLIWMPH